MKWLSLGLLILAGGSALADPGFLTSGGQPQLMAGKTTVRMTAEKVVLTVFADRVEVDGTYHFQNLGKACSVRMGFPEDASFGFYGKHASTIFSHYQSFVDGKQASTKLEPGKTPDEQWDVQTVSFASHGKRLVHVSYRTSLGAMGGALAMTAYTLHTGASWDGTIGSVVVEIKFTASAELDQPFDIWHGSAKQMTKDLFMKQPAKRGGLIVLGPGDMTVSGDTVTLTVKELKPTANDDVWILFRFPPKQLEKIKKPGATTPVVPPA